MPDVQITPLQTPVNYTSRDYLAFRQAMLDLIPSLMPEWTDRSEGDFGMVLIELFAYIADILSFYGDRVANEAFLDTAVQNSSVLAIASMLDYRPTENTPAVVPGNGIQFTLQPSQQATPQQIFIPRLTQIATQPSGTGDPIVFETDLEIYVTPTPTGGTATVTATQGITFSGTDGTGEVLGTSDGTADQQFTLFHHPIILASLHVWIDEGNGLTEWQYFEHMIDANADDRAFSVVKDDLAISTVTLGDGVSGRVPAPGATIKAVYRVGCGAAGNVGVGTISNVVTQIPGVQSVTNIAAAQGGADDEAIDHVRKMAPRALSTAGRGVSASDFTALALRVAGVQKAAAQAALYSQINLYVAPASAGSTPLDSTGVPLPTSLISSDANAVIRNRLAAYLADKKMVTATITILDASFVRININAQVNVLPNYDQETVRRAVVTNVSNLFATENTDFGQRVTISSVYRALNQTKGVDYGFVSLLARFGGTGVADIALGINEIPVSGVIGISATGGLTLSI